MLPQFWTLPRIPQIKPSYTKTKAFANVRFRLPKIARDAYDENCRDTQKMFKWRYWERTKHSAGLSSRDLCSDIDNFLHHFHF